MFSFGVFFQMYSISKIKLALAFLKNGEVFTEAGRS